MARNIIDVSLTYEAMQRVDYQVKQGRDLNVVINKLVMQHLPPVPAPVPIPKEKQDVIMTENETAEMLGMAAGTLRVWRSTGKVKLPYVKVGRYVRYKLSAVNAFLEANTHE